MCDSKTHAQQSLRAGRSRPTHFVASTGLGRVSDVTDFISTFYTMGGGVRRTDVWGASNTSRV
jgi:hypothetical protein